MIFSWLWFAKHVELSLIFYYIKGLLSFLILYQEKDDRMKSNPDLYFNCATVSFSSLSLSLYSESCWWGLHVGEKEFMWLRIQSSPQILGMRLCCCCLWGLHVLFVFRVMPFYAPLLYQHEEHKYVVAGYSLFNHSYVLYIYGGTSVFRSTNI